MKSVLVVEDNKDNLQIITYALKRAGYEVFAAETGEDGVDMAIASCPFMILMDINLPGIDGIEATRRIRAAETDGSMPIIAITSYAMRGDREQILAAGCNGYFEKPFDPLTIVDKIHKLLGGGTMKALVVDDIAENVSLLKTLLTVHGYEVATAANGFEALEQLQQAPVDLIISDILMPKMDGFQLCRAVKADEALRDIPFIFYTATYTTANDKTFALSLGACRFILKPADPADFMTIIQDIVVNKIDQLNGSGEVTIEAETEYLKEHQLRLIKKLDDKITALEASEERSRNLIVELTRKQAEMERFTYTVSHDLKTPLVTILGFAGQLELDLEKGEREHVKADLAFIQGAASKMKDLLRDLLQLTLAGRAIGEPQPVALQALVQQVTKELDCLFQDIELRVTMPPDPVVVSGDPDRLNEVFQNLLENAVKFTKGTPKPVIEVGCTVEEGVAVCFVRDNGIGIPVAYQEKVFGLFEKLDPALEGTGIGLAIVRRIIEEHGGRAWVESAGTGCGSKFLFALPVIKP